MHFKPLFLLLIIYLPRFLIIHHHLNIFFTFLLTSYIFELLDVNAFHIFILTQLTSYLIAAHPIFSSVIVLITKVFGALIHLPGLCMYPGMCFYEVNFPAIVQSFFTVSASNVRSLGNSPNLLLSSPSTIFISSPVSSALTTPSSPPISHNSTSPTHDLHPFTSISTSSHSTTPCASLVSSATIRQFSSSLDNEHPAH